MCKEVLKRIEDITKDIIKNSVFHVDTKNKVRCIGNTCKNCVKKINKENNGV